MRTIQRAAITSVSPPSPHRKRRVPSRATLVLFLVIAGTNLASIALATSQTVAYGLFRTCWFLSPSSRLVPILDYADFNNAPADIDWETLKNAAIPLVILAILLVLLVRMLFGLCFLAYRRLGWPPYISNLDRGPLLQAAWHRMARQSVWIWPFYVTFFIITDGLSYSSHWCGFPRISVDGMVPFLVLAGVVLLYWIFASKSITSHICSSLPTDSRCCAGCAYLLRGLSEPRCPECGRTFDPTGPITFRLRGPFRKCPRLISTIFTIVVALLFSSPVWTPRLFDSLPKSWAARIPRALVPAQMMDPLFRTHLPLRYGTICVIRRGDELAVIELAPKYDPKLACTVRICRESAGATPVETWRSQFYPLHDSRFAIENQSWRLDFTTGPRRHIWLAYPGKDYDIRGYRPDELPGQFRALANSPLPPTP